MELGGCSLKHYTSGNWVQRQAEMHDLPFAVPVLGASQLVDDVADS